MRSPCRASQKFAALAALVLVAFTVSVARAAPDIALPPGVDWTSATPEQIREAVFAAVKNNPDSAVEVVQAAIESVKATGRYPNAGTSDGKQVVDPDDGVVTLPEIADQIAQAAIQANPAMAAQITQAVSQSLAQAATTSGAADGGSGGGGSGGGGGAPPLPGGFGGGGGGSGGGTIYSN